jgi:L-2-hydroxyglutarate oxidase
MKYDIVIIGGGIVGLGVALELAKANAFLKIVVLEKESAMAKHQSGNNSGVIHSGIYYKPGSMKAKHCIQGRKKLLNFCNENNITYELCGKLIIASNENETKGLDFLFQRGVENGLEGLKKLSSSEIKTYEPHAEGVAGIFVPQTGIVDFKEVVFAYARQFEKNNGQILFNQKVIAINRKFGISEVQTELQNFEAKLILNCAGLYSDKIALLNRRSLDVRIIPFRGEYYKFKTGSRHYVNNLIYPVPDPNFPFLGVHFTRRINGEVEAGPNAVFAFKREGYKFFHIDFREFLTSIFWTGFGKVVLKHWKTGVGEFYKSLSKKAFTNELKKFIPEISEADLESGGAGVRAQAVDRKGNLVSDFLILEDEYQIDIINAPSPAATASLSIGEIIAERALKRFF